MQKAPASCLILLRLNTEALIYRVNCQWKFIGDCLGSDYLPPLLEEVAFLVGVASFSVGASCSLCSDGCSEAEAISLLSVPPVIFPDSWKQGVNPNHSL